MSVITLTTEKGTFRKESETPVSAQEFLQECGCLLTMPCGGGGRCGKCRVIAKGGISPVSEEEKQLLKPGELQKGIRLLCRLQLISDAELTLCMAETSAQIRVNGILPDIEKNPLFEAFGAAVDIGTTTLAVQICGEQGILGSASAPNPQRSFGADVISRIGQSLAGHGEALAQSVRGAIADLLQTAAKDAKIQPEQLDAFVLTGNTTMLYLLTGKNPKSLSSSPFEADELFGYFFAAKELGLPCKEGAKAYLPRCASAFVGADITTALLAGQTCRGEETVLFADIGTNGEIALWNDKTLTCCSTAAGPAFEGVGLSCGMQGAAGAIDHVSEDSGQMHRSVIGGGDAIGICGSGVVDALAIMLASNDMEESGVLNEESTRYEEQNEPSIALTNTVYITQKDIRMVQLAKSAVCAGINTLLRVSGVPQTEVNRLQIAGGFGSYLDLKSAARIGLFPFALQNKAEVLGNAALSGAVMLLMNRSLITQSEQLAKTAKTIELSTNPIFMEEYTENMFFPPTDTLDMA